MARDRLRLNKNHIEIMKQWKNENYLGLNDSETKDIFLLLASLGLDNPKELQSVDGYVLLSYIKTYEKSIMASILLGEASSNEEIDKVADAELSYLIAERCAESGFDKLEEYIRSANNDNNFLTKRMMSKLDLLYEQNVMSNL